MKGLTADAQRISDAFQTQLKMVFNFGGMSTISWVIHHFDITQA